MVRNIKSVIFTTAKEYSQWKQETKDSEYKEIGLNYDNGKYVCTFCTVG